LITLPGGLIDPLEVTSEGEALKQKDSREEGVGGLKGLM
jgi:hypothetical protein